MAMDERIVGWGTRLLGAPQGQGLEDLITDADGFASSCGTKG